MGDSLNIPLFAGVIVFLITVLGLGIGLSEAAMNPYPPFCENQGYIVIQDNGTGYCDFGDGVKCELREFYDGKCGQEYNTGNFECVKEGKPVFSFDECCEGLEPTPMQCGLTFWAGQTMCRKSPDTLQRFWEWFMCLFGYKTW